jgi:hypothetical protein
VVPWAVLVQIVEPHDLEAKTGRPPFGIETMPRIHNLQQWFGLSDRAMGEALHDVPLYRDFAKLDGAAARLPADGRRDTGVKQAAFGDAGHQRVQQPASATGAGCSGS